MKKKKPSNQAAIPTKNESNKGDSKGEKSFNDLRIELSKEREKNLSLESEIKRLKADQAKKELRDKDLDYFLEDNGKYLIEVERLLGLVPSFAQWGYKLEDKEFNQKFSHSLFKNSSPRERVIYCSKLLEEAIPKYRKHFDKGLKLKSEEAKDKTKNSFTPLEKKLYKFCLKHSIDITKSPDIIEVKVLDKGFKNLKGKKLLNRSTVSKMKDKIRKNPSLIVDL